MHGRTWRFWIVSFTVTLRPFHSIVAFWMSSPTFLGDCWFWVRGVDKNGGGSQCVGVGADSDGSTIISHMGRASDDGERGAGPRSIDPSIPPNPSIQQTLPTLPQAKPLGLTRPRGPTLGARVDAEPTSPPTARRMTVALWCSMMGREGG